MTQYVFPEFRDRAASYIRYELGETTWEGGDVHFSGPITLRVTGGRGFVTSEMWTKSFRNNKSLSLRFHGVNLPMHVGEDPNIIWSSDRISKNIKNGAVSDEWDINLPDGNLPDQLQYINWLAIEPSVGDY